jgi:hypothetical protein
MDRFGIAGVIRTWDPVRRTVQIAERTLTVAVDVRIGRVAVGVHVLVAGYQYEGTTPGLITRLILRAPRVDLDGRGALLVGTAA